MNRLTGRISRLEAQLTPPEQRRMWLICMGDRECQKDAVTRHGIQPAEHDLVVIFRYGKCLSCKGEDNLGT